MVYKYRIVERQKMGTRHDWRPEFLNWVKTNHPDIVIPDYLAEKSMEFTNIMKNFYANTGETRNYIVLPAIETYYILERYKLFYWVPTGLSGSTITTLKSRINDKVQDILQKEALRNHQVVKEEFTLPVKLCIEEGFL